MRFLHMSLIMTVVTSCSPGRTPPPTPVGALSSVLAEAGGGADAVIYTNAVVHTLDEARPRATGLRIEGGQVTHLFDAEPPADVAGRRVDLGGAVVLPGLTDAHLHLRGIGLAARQLDLRGTRSAAEVARAVGRALAAEAETSAPGRWLRGRGWDQNDWAEAEYPTHELLDAVAPDRPVYLRRVDGHALWVNARAMELAGITGASPDPDGGQIIRDGDGNPTGVFVDNAVDLLDAQLPEPTPEELRADFLAAMARCRQVGLTAVHDMGTTPAELEVLRALEREGLLTVRVFVYLGGPFSEIEPLLAEPPAENAASLLQVVGVKLYADGALGSRGAALLEPYADSPDSTGLLVTAPAELERQARAVHAAGYQVAIHAIGDRGNRVGLDVLAAVQGEDRSHRHRVEHAQVLAPAEIPRFAALGVFASMQPTHATSDMSWAEARVGPERLRGAYAWRRLLESGATLAFGSDAPVESHDPWLGIYAAVTRQDADGEPAGGWLPDQRLQVREALVGFASVPPQIVGLPAPHVLTAGARADLSIVDRDPFTSAPADLDDVRTLRTVVAGREVYVAE